MEILHDIGNKIGFDWKLSITHLINFLILFFLLVKFALPNIKRTIDERTKKIKEGLQLQEESVKIFEDAKLESQKIISVAHTKQSEIVATADEAAKQILTKANEKQQEIIQQAEQVKSVSKEAGLKDAEKVFANSLPQVLKKISTAAFGDKLSAEVNDQFITKVLKDSYGK